LFCKNYTSMEKEFFGNWVASYINAYKLNKSIKMHYDSARVNAAKLLTNANICKRINELLEEWGFNDQNVDKQTLFLINQQFDYRAKAKWIEIYNKLKKRGADWELPKSIDNLWEKLAKLSGDFVREMLRGRDIKNGNNWEAFNPKTD
jgi:hypothetical protein